MLQYAGARRMGNVHFTGLDGVRESLKCNVNKHAISLAAISTCTLVTSMYISRLIANTHASMSK